MSVAAFMSVIPISIFVVSAFCSMLEIMPIPIFRHILAIAYIAVMIFVSVIPTFRASYDRLSIRTDSLVQVPAADNNLLAISAPCAINSQRRKFCRAIQIVSHTRSPPSISDIITIIYYIMPCRTFPNFIASILAHAIIVIIITSLISITPNSAISHRKVESPAHAIACCDSQYHPSRTNHCPNALIHIPFYVHIHTNILRNAHLYCYHTKIFNTSQLFCHF